MSWWNNKKIRYALQIIEGIADFKSNIAKEEVTVLLRKSNIAKRRSDSIIKEEQYFSRRSDITIAEEILV